MSNWRFFSDTDKDSTKKNTTPTQRHNRKIPHDMKELLGTNSSFNTQTGYHGLIHNIQHVTLPKSSHCVIVCRKTTGESLGSMRESWKHILFFLSTSPPPFEPKFMCTVLVFFFKVFNISISRHFMVFKYTFNKSENQ